MPAMSLGRDQAEPFGQNSYSCRAIIGRVGVDFGLSVGVHSAGEDANVVSKVLLGKGADALLHVRFSSPAKIRRTGVLRSVVESGAGGRVLVRVCVERGYGVVKRPIFSRLR